VRGLVASVVLLLLLPVALAGAGTAPALSGFGAWSASGSRLAFVASAARGTRGYLWVERFGSGRPVLLRGRPPVGQQEIDQLAPGPNGTWASLERTVGNSESYYAVDLISSRGGGTQVASAGGPAGAGGGGPVSSIPQVLGDGTFLGYLYVTPGGLVQLYRITPTGRARHVADLDGVTGVEDAAVANGTLAVREANGDVAVFTLAGEKLATIEASAASLALTANRVVVRTHDRRLGVYGVHGGLVHDWQLHAAGFAGGLAAYGGYAVYLGGNKALHAVRLATGTDRVVARAGAGWFWNGAALQAPGVVVPLTTRQGTAFPVVLRFVRAAALR
jgi:hypothetical protein